MASNRYWKWRWCWKRAPRLLLLDEPSLGLSPRNQESVFETALAIRDSGITLMIVEQNTKRALAISDRAVVLELGRMILEGPARERRQRPTRQGGLSRRGGNSYQAP